MVSQEPEVTMENIDEVEGEVVETEAGAEVVEEAPVEAEAEAPNMPQPGSIQDEAPTPPDHTDMPAPEVIPEVTPEPVVVEGDSGPQDVPVESAGSGEVVVSDLPPIEVVETAEAVTELVPAPSDGGNETKPISEEAIQQARDMMPADVEQVIRAIAKEAATEAIQEQVHEDALLPPGLAEPGHPSS